MNILQTIAAEEKARLIEKRAIPDFQPGDTLRVMVKIKEGERERIQAFEGVCIARAGGGVNENFTVRKISFGEGDADAEHRLHRGQASRRRAARQALLPARSPRQVGPDRREADRPRAEGRGGAGNRQGRRPRRHRSVRHSSRRYRASRYLSAER